MACYMKMGCQRGANFKSNTPKWGHLDMLIVSQCSRTLRQTMGVMLIDLCVGYVYWENDVKGLRVGAVRSVTSIIDRYHCI